MAVIGEYVAVAMCVSEICKEDVQGIVYPFIKRLEQNKCRAVILNSCNDLYSNNPFNDGEACVYELLQYGYTDVVIVFAQLIKNDIVIGKIIQTANRCEKPVIIVDGDRFYDGCINISYDTSDAFYDVMVHLVEHHKLTKINCIAGFKDNPVSDEKVAIYKKVLAKNGIPFEEERFGYGNFYDAPTEEVMEKFLNSPLGLPEAIVCINDTMAITVCEVLARHGISVPEDVIVTGFDGIEQERYNFPRLTTCRRDMDKLAEFLYDIVSRLMSGEKVENKLVFPYTADYSESCGCRKKSVISINKSINKLYARINADQQFDHLMNNMTAKMSNVLDVDTITGVIKHYATFNCYLCLNSDFASSFKKPHRSNFNPFTTVFLSDKYFFDTEEVVYQNFHQSKLIPSWEESLKRTEPLIVTIIHNQDNVHGYLAAYASDYDFDSFSIAARRIQKFAINIDNCTSSYIQQSYLRASNARLRDIQNKIISSFADLVESRDDFTGQHIKRTSEYLRLLVNHLAGKQNYAAQLMEGQREMMIKAAPLHDIGKIKIPDDILNKPGRLTAEEFEIIKTHTMEGHSIIEKTLSNIESREYIKIASQMALYHHEKWDGSGYPCKLSGEDIPLCARIMAVVDVFDALTSKRVYKEAFTSELAFDILAESKGSHFDPEIADAFIEIREQVNQVLNELQ